ncbi:MAG: MSCRAMM family protein, partial [Fibrobacterota bacterium]
VNPRMIIGCFFCLVFYANSLTISGIITDTETGEPLNNSQITLRHGIRIGGGGAWNIDWTRLERIWTEEDGRYSFAGLEESGLRDVYKVIVEPEGYNAQKSSNITLENDLELDFDLLMETEGKLSVSVVDMDNTPVEGASICAELLVTEGEIYSAWSDDNGKMDFPVVIAGNYRINVFKSGFLIAAEHAKVETDAHEKITVTLQQTDSDYKVIEGTLLNPQGNPVEGYTFHVKVGSQSDRVNYFDRTDENGAFTICGIDPLHEQSKTEIDVDGYFPLDTIFNIPGDTTTVVFQLVDDGIQVIPDNTVSKDSAFAVTHTGTHYRISGLPANNTYTVTVYSLTGRIVMQKNIKSFSRIISIPATENSRQPLLINIQDIPSSFSGTTIMY